MAEPDEYHKSTTIKLYFNSKADCSIDEAGATKYSKSKTKAKANTHGTWVQQAQKDLIALGYLAAKGSDGNPNDDGYFGPGTKRAVSRFQRHAARVYRMDTSKAIQDVKPAEVFAGKETGEVDPATAKEMRKWIDKKWVNPVGRFQIKELSPGLGGRLREDAADAWEAVVKDVHSKGGILIGVYGDTLRPFRKTDKAGTSRYSFHYCGRAVDISQRLANFAGMVFKGLDLKVEKKDPETEDQKNRRLAAEAEIKKCEKVDPNNESFFNEEVEFKKFGKVKRTGKRYFLKKEEADGKVFWRIYCRTQLQDGTQGKKFNKGDVSCWDLGGNTTYKIPEGHYIDLTEIIESSGKFQRIKAHDGWEKNTNKTEWWHFQYAPDKQATFQDEMELIGITAEEMDKQGWDTDAMKDHKPG
jgi:hypothetical protein